jgi:hypothetical protein
VGEPLHRPRFTDERGAALLTAILIVVLFAAIAAAVTIASRVETLVAANFRQASETLHAAEGIAALAVHELSSIPDWTLVLTGGATAGFVDGPSAGSRRLPGGDTVRLCCGAGTITDDVQQRAYGGHDWGADTPRWQMFAWGPADRWLAPGRIDSVVYAVVWVADDPHDGDGDPAVDSNHTLAIHAEAFGAAGGRRVVEVLVTRPMLPAGGLSAGVRNLLWRDIRW